MLEQSDLPDPWVLSTPAFIEGEVLDGALGLGPTRAARVEVGRFDGGPGGRALTDGGWSRIHNSESGDSFVLRIQRPENFAGAKVSALVALPNEITGSVTGKSLRSVPIGAIEAAVDARAYESVVIRDLARQVGRSDGLNFDVYSPVGTPRENPLFYQCVALQHWGLRRDGVSNPTGRMVEINMKPLSTVQSWITEARRRKYLAPGRPGRAG
jgi:hypothetical protein